MGFSFSGMGENAALAFPTLKDWSERSDEQSAGAEALLANQNLAGVSDGAIMAVTPPPIDGLGNLAASPCACRTVAASAAKRCWQPVTSCWARPTATRRSSTR